MLLINHNLFHSGTAKKFLRFKTNSKIFPTSDNSFCELGSISHWFEQCIISSIKSEIATFDFQNFYGLKWKLPSGHLIIHANLIPLVTMIEKLLTLNFANIGSQHHIWQIYLLTNFRKKSEFSLVDLGGPKFRFFLLELAVFISRSKDLCGLARVTNYLSWFVPLESQNVLHTI